MTVRLNVDLAALVLLGALTLSACASNVPPPEPAVQPAPALPPEVKVGLLLPLSGPAEALGLDMRHAAEMALFDVGPNDIVLLPRDTRGTPEGASRGAQEVIGEGAELILGPLFSSAVSAVGPIASQANVRVLAFSNVSSVASDGTFLLGFRPEEQVERVVRYALGQGLTRIGALAPDDAYGQTAMDALRQAVIEGGGELGPTMLYPASGDASAVVREIADYGQRQAALEQERSRLRALGTEGAQAELRALATADTFGDPPFDAILLADGGDRLRSVASLLTFFDVDPATTRFLGTMRWQDDPRVLQEGALQGGWFAGPAPDALGVFQRRFASSFGTQPQPLVALAYDATALAVVTARELGDRGFSAATLTNPDGFDGSTGLFRLQPDGLTQHALAILEITGGSVRMIDPPPTRFLDLMASPGFVTSPEAGASDIVPAPGGSSGNLPPAATTPAPAAGGGSTTF